ncbi:MAG: hypothetical protein COA57_09490 [Flavobacteriales bacterium]|nr:MAG: hypothetical protein COA57_09490 [Flavobacteriales bacterium]
MKRNISIALAGVTLLITPVLFTGCKKYDEGPSLSLRTKKARVANEWKVDFAYDYKDGENTTSDYFGETWEFSKDGEWIERDNGTIDKSGTWEFVSDKESIKITKPFDVDYYDILKLKNKEMWLKDQDEELHLVPAN